MLIDTINILIIGITAFTTHRAFQSPVVFNKLKFNAYAIKHHKEWYRFFSHALIHADWQHLGFNMLTLFFFGPFVYANFEVHFGDMATVYYILLYLISIAGSSVMDYDKYKNASWYNAVGASGAISAVLFASIIFKPWNMIYMPFPIPGFLYGIGYLWYLAKMGKKGGDNIGHYAHFWGAICGVVFIIILKPTLLSRFFDLLLKGNSFF